MTREINANSLDIHLKGHRNMSRKIKKIKGEGAKRSCPPKAKVARSNRAECTTLPLPKRNQVTEIPQGYEVLETFRVVGFEHKRTLLIRQVGASSLDIHLKSRRSVKRLDTRQKPAARSA